MPLITRKQLRADIDWIIQERSGQLGDGWVRVLLERLDGLEEAAFNDGMEAAHAERGTSS